MGLCQSSKIKNGSINNLDIKKGSINNLDIQYQDLIKKIHKLEIKNVYLEKSIGDQSDRINMKLHMLEIKNGYLENSLEDAKYIIKLYENYIEGTETKTSITTKIKEYKERNI